MKDFLRWLARPLWRRLKGRIDLAVDERLRAQGYPVPWQPPAAPAPAPVPAPPPAPTLAGLGGQPRLFVPPCPPGWPVQGEFMAHSTCSSADLMHPEYARICAMLHHAALYHRKVWEWAFIIHHFERAGVLREGARGIGFGVGREPLSSLFARLGAGVLATDAPQEIGEQGGWSSTSQHADALASLWWHLVVDKETFARKVRYQPCDMNAIPDGIGRFDFCWSSCCFEHLGDLEAGMRFVVESVEKTLEPGGIACHTTEFNLSSNDETIESGGTVLYRRRDLDELVRRLRERGHDVLPFTVAPDSHYLDGFVDVPPYTHNPHLKLQLAGYVTTSAGIVVRRGR